MKILLEGPDGSGKTTLAKILCEAFKLEYLHFKHEDDNEYYFDQIISNNKYIKNSLNGILVDRYIPSEITYGTVLRGSSRLNVTSELTKDAVEMFDKIIFCLPSDKDAYIRNFKRGTERREEMVTDVKKMEAILSGYQDLYVRFKNEYPNLAYKFSIYDYQKTFINKF